jgi:hypothetical protein
VEQSKVFDPYFERVMLLTSAEVWRDAIPMGASAVDMIRHPWIANFLDRNGEDIDRVLMIHAFDCYFHRDPFEVLNFDAMGFFDEGRLVEQSSSTMSWMMECFTKKVGRQVSNATVLNAGVIFGPAKLFVEFETVIRTALYWRQCRMDWPILTLIVALGRLTEAGVPYRILSCDGPVLTATACSWKVVEFGGWPEPTNSGGVVPHIVHQWRGIGQLREMYIQKCDLTQYMTEVEIPKGAWSNWSAPVRGP